MPRGDKSSYTDKQKRQAEHIEEGYEHRGVGKVEAERRAWATVNAETGAARRAVPGAARRRTMRRRARAVVSVARRPRIARRPNDRPRRRRPP